MKLRRVKVRLANRIVSYETVSFPKRIDIYEVTGAVRLLCSWVGSRHESVTSNLISWVLQFGRAGKTNGRVASVSARSIGISVASPHYDSAPNPARSPRPPPQPEVHRNSPKFPSNALMYRRAGFNFVPRVPAAEDIQSRNRVLLRATAARKVPQTLSPPRCPDGLMKAIVRPIRNYRGASRISASARPPFCVKLAARRPY